MAEQPERLNMARTLKIGSFHIGSAFSDMLTSAIWNRVLISNLGLPATPVALLSALRYLLAPLAIWAGNRSDSHPLFGKHRLPYIWSGRAMMAVGLLLLPLTTIQLATDSFSPTGWLLATLAFLIYGVGSLISGSPFLALLRDNTPPTKRGQALSIVQIMLVTAMAISPGIYGALMKSYDPALFWRVVLIGAGVAIPFWIFSILGEDRMSIAVTQASEPVPFSEVLGSIWRDPRTRTFFYFMALSSMAAFAQDAILEPFGADVFGLDVGATTRFNAYWGVGVLVAMIGTTIITRKRAPHDQSGTARIGLILSALPLALLGAAALLHAQVLLVPALILFGFGYGVFAVGGISLMMAMTSDRHAGAYLGLWTLAQLVFRGVGIAGGGALRDIGLVLSGSHVVAYATVFFAEAAGMLICLVLLARSDVAGFVRGAPQERISPLAALAD